MNGLIYVALGGAMGASARHLAGIGVTRVTGHGFPYGTMSVNIIGSLLMGLLVGWLAHRTGDNENLRLLLGVGLLGGFTTFSAFSLDAITLYQRKAYGPMIGYISASVILSLAALVVGLMIMRKWGAA